MENIEIGMSLKKFRERKNSENTTLALSKIDKLVDEIIKMAAEDDYKSLDGENFNDYAIKNGFDNSIDEVTNVHDSRVGKSLIRSLIGVKEASEPDGPNAMLVKGILEKLDSSSFDVIVNHVGSHFYSIGTIDLELKSLLAKDLKNRPKRI